MHGRRSSDASPIPQHPFQQCRRVSAVAPTRARDFGAIHHMSDANSPTNFRDEVRLILQRFVQVWHLVPRKHKRSLAGATLVMALTSAIGTVVALLLGGLVDAVIGIRNGDVDVTAVYGHAGLFLGGIAARLPAARGVQRPAPLPRAKYLLARQS